LAHASGYQNTLLTIDLCLGRGCEKCSYARQSVVYVVENKCFPPSGDGSYGNNLCLGDAGHSASL
ncbi:MAG: hypothetical protein ACI9G1_004128, partial [Pirellulaceae bacterium]